MNSLDPTTHIWSPRPTLLTYNAKDNCCFRADYALAPLVQAASPVFRLLGAAERPLIMIGVLALVGSLTAAAPTGLCAWEGSATSPAPAIGLSNGDANWNKYRYRVFQTIVPLRNVIWSKDTL